MSCFLIYSFPPEDIQDFTVQQPRETQGAFPVEENTQWVSKGELKLKHELIEIKATVRINYYIWVESSFLRFDM